MYKFSAVLYAILLGFVMPNNVLAASVRLSGECVGVKVYTDGLIITDTMTLTDINGKKVNIASDYGIRPGDILKKVNGIDVTSVKAVSDAVDNGNITLTLMRNQNEFETEITPIKTKDGAKLGLWLRDSTAGLGTITCFVGDKFVGLGHGICDIDTGNIMPVKYGTIQECTGMEIKKGERGNPGAITGQIDGEKLGTVTQNTHCGIAGRTISTCDGKDIKTADKSEIRTGNAQILCDVDGKGVKEYEIEIKRVTLGDKSGRDMVIKITDKELIQKTGGIVQGMSGAPLIQNGKLVGAVTHVFVNDPTRGYAIFIENMLDTIK